MAGELDDYCNLINLKVLTTSNKFSLKKMIAAQICASTQGYYNSQS